MALEIAKLKAALKEDIGSGDVTSRLLVSSKAIGEARIIAKEAGVFCGGEIAGKIFKLTDRKIKPRLHIKDGQVFSKGKTLLTIKGPVRGIVAGERTALNFLGHLCGIASRTREFVKRVPKSVKILDTRKTTPGWRALEKYAVQCGGGSNHRMGLYDAVFVKENHRKFGKLKNLREIAGKFEIEVRNRRELIEALPLRPRVILFDNFKPGPLKRAVETARRYNSRIILEASGGMTLQNIAAYAKTGVDQISIGSLTHSVRTVDLSLLIK